MAVRAIEGFEVNGSTSALLDVYEAVEFDDGDAFVDGYRGGSALLSETGERHSRITISLGANHNQIILGMRVLAVAPKDGTQAAILWKDLAGEAKLWIQVRRISPVSPDYVLELRNGDPDPIASTPTIKGEPWAWAAVELRAIIGAALGAPPGEFELRIDRATVASESDVNTIAQGSAAVVNRVEFRAHADSDWTGDEPSFMAIDDIYIADVPASPGDEVADFLGAPVLRENRVAAEAVLNEWTPHGGSDHALLVDDPPDHDGDTTYLEAETDSDEEYFTREPVSDEIGDEIYAIKVQTVARLNVTGTKNMAQVVRVDGSAYGNVSYPVNSMGYKRRELVMDTDPSIGGRWQKERIENDVKTGFTSV